MTVYRFYERLWSHGWHSLCYEPRDAEVKKPLRFEHFNTAASLHHRIGQLAGANNVWWGVNGMEQKPARRGGDADITHCRSLFVDLDWIDPAHKSEALPTEETVRTVIAGFQPTVQVSTGHGLQCYWLLQRHVDPHQWNILEDGLVAAIQAAGLHTEATSVSNILRAPGSTNFKATPVQVVIDYQDGPEYTAERCEELWPKPVTPPAPPVEPRPLKVTGGWFDDAKDAFEASNSWDDVLGRHGWRPSEQTNNAWLHPTATSSQSATLNDNNRLVIWSTNPDLPAPLRATGSSQKPSFDRVDIECAYRYGSIETADRTRFLEQFRPQPALTSAAEPTPPLHGTTVTGSTETAATPTERSTWYPVDLTSALNGDPLPGAELLRRNDGNALLYRGKTHQFFGESESMKSWGAVCAAAEVMNGGENVLWVDFEDNERTLVERLREVGVSDTAIVNQLHFIHPDEPLIANGDTTRFTAGRLALNQLLRERVYALAVIDAATGALTNEGFSIMAAEEWGQLDQHLFRPLADKGAAVVIIDHVPKNPDNRRDATGTAHKRQSITGASYRFDPITKVRRTTGDPFTGSVELLIMKDRPGWVRKNSHTSKDRDVAGVLELTAEPDGRMSWEIKKGDDLRAPIPSHKLLCEIARFLDTYDGASKKAVEDGVVGNAHTTRAALKYMTELPRCWVAVERKGNGHYHSLTPAGRRELLDNE